MRVERLYEGKEAEYFGKVRRDVLAPIPRGEFRVLEIGCGDGSTGAALKAEGRAVEVVGVELSEEAGRSARSRLDRVFIGNIEDLELPYAPEYFDYMIMADVLEHLVDPWAVMRRMSHYVKENGTVIASIPNVRNWRVLCDLAFKGKWTYTDSGLLDRTHLRFFTKRSMIELFERTGYSVVKVELLGERSRMVTRWLAGPLQDLLTPQYLVVALRKRPAHHSKAS